LLTQLVDFEGPTILMGFFANLRAFGAAEVLFGGSFGGGYSLEELLSVGWNQTALRSAISSVVSRVTVLSRVRTSRA
jgi:hypothetical protein